MILRYIDSIFTFTFTFSYPSFTSSSASVYFPASSCLAPPVRSADTAEIEFSWPQKRVQSEEMHWSEVLSAVQFSPVHFSSFQFSSFVSLCTPQSRTMNTSWAMTTSSFDYLW